MPARPYRRLSSPQRLSVVQAKHALQAHWKPAVGNCSAVPGRCSARWARCQSLESGAPSMRGTEIHQTRVRPRGKQEAAGIACSGYISRPDNSRAKPHCWAPIYLRTPSRDHGAARRFKASRRTHVWFAALHAIAQSRHLLVLHSLWHQSGETLIT